MQNTEVAVSSSPTHGYPTTPRERVVVTPWGILGDAHSGLIRDSFMKPGTRKWNDRPISIVANESRQRVNKELGLNLQAGDFNEQILVEGLGDLGWVLFGSLVYFEDSGVRLEVVDYSTPCQKLAKHTGANIRDLNKLLVDNKRHTEPGKPYSGRGILAKVIWPGIIEPGDTMHIQAPNPPLTEAEAQLLMSSFKMPPIG
jgi:MOSC domain-containing protein YiiM